MKKEEEKAIPTIHVPRVDKGFSSIDEAIDHFLAYEYIRHPVALGDCHINNDGIFTAGSEELHLTDISFRKLVDRLTLPYNFIQYTSPTDLSVHIINRMLKEKSDVKVCCWRTNGTVETFTSEDFSPIHHIIFLNALNKSFEKEDALEIRLLNTQLRVVKLFDLKQEPIPGDVFQFGTEFINYDIFSETSYLHAEAFLYRLVCSNGIKIKNALQDYSKMFQPPVTDIYLQDKIKEICYSDNELRGILNALKWMSGIEIASHRVRLFKTFKSLVNKYIPLPDENPFKEGDTYYDVFNHVTQSV